MHVLRRVQPAALTVKDGEHHADPEILSWWQGLFELPCVAIGGITPANAGELVAAGADFLAVSGAVWSHKDGPAAAVRAFAAVLEGQPAG